MHAAPRVADCSPRAKARLQSAQLAGQAKSHAKGARVALEPKPGGHRLQPMWSLHALSAQLATLQLMHWTCAVSVPISGSGHSNGLWL